MRWLAVLLALAPVLAPAALVVTVADEVTAYRTLAAQGLRVQQRVATEEVRVGTELLIAEREHGKLVLRPVSTLPTTGGSRGVRAAAWVSRGVEVPVCMAGPDAEVVVLHGRRRRFQAAANAAEASFPLRTTHDEVVESLREWRGRRRRVTTLQSVLREYRLQRPGADLMTAATLLDLVTRDRLEHVAHRADPGNHYAVALVAATWFTVVARRGERVLDVRSDAIVEEEPDVTIDADARASGSTASTAAIRLREQIERCLDHIYQATVREVGLELLVSQEALLPRVQSAFPAAPTATLQERMTARTGGRITSSADRRSHTKWQGTHHGAAYPMPDRPTWGMIDFPSAQRVRRRRVGRSVAAGAVLMPVAAALAVPAVPGLGPADRSASATRSARETQATVSTGQGVPGPPEGRAPRASEIAGTQERMQQPPESATEEEVGEPVQQMEVSSRAGSSVRAPRAETDAPAGQPPPSGPDAEAGAAEPGDVPGSPELLESPESPEPRFAFAGTGTNGEGGRVWYFVDAATRRVVAVTSDGSGDGADAGDDDP